MVDSLGRLKTQAEATAELSCWKRHLLGHLCVSMRAFHKAISGVLTQQVIPMTVCELKQIESIFTLTALPYY